VDVLHCLLRGARTGNAGNVVDGILESNRVLNAGELLIREVSDILKTVDLAEHVVGVVKIFAEAANLIKFADIEIL